MKVLHVVHGYPPEVIGGTELYVANLARTQLSAGHEVRVFAGSLEWKPKLQVDHVEQDGIRVTRVHREDLYFDRWDKGYHPGVAREFERYLVNFRPDLVHVHHWLRLTTDLVATAARHSIPAIITIHDLYPTCPRVFRLKGNNGDELCDAPMGVEPCVPCVPRWRFQGDESVADLVRSYRADMSRELELASAVIAPSRSHGEFLRAMLGFSATPLHVLQHGTLSADVSTAASTPDGDDRSRGKLNVAYWSHLTFLKGTHVLMEAVRRANCRKDLRVHLFGDAPDPAYKERIEEAAAGLDVIFHGTYRPPDLVGVGIDLAVIPTLCRESYSFILDEAVRLGVPVLATDAGALRDRATDRVQLFAHNDPGDLAGHLDRFAERRELLEQMRAADPPTLLTFEEHAEKLLGLYERALAQGPPVPPANDDSRRLLEQWQRREVAFQELVRIEKWEDVVDEQQRRIKELEDLLSSEPGEDPETNGTVPVS